jgi:hypothetical protein
MATHSILQAAYPVPIELFADGNQIAAGPQTFHRIGIDLEHSIRPQYTVGSPELFIFIPNPLCGRLSLECCIEANSNSILEQFDNERTYQLRIVVPKDNQRQTFTMDDCRLEDTELRPANHQTGTPQWERLGFRIGNCDVTVA